MKSNRLAPNANSEFTAVNETQNMHSNVALGAIRARALWNTHA